MTVLYVAVLYAHASKESSDRLRDRIRVYSRSMVRLLVVMVLTILSQFSPARSSWGLVRLRYAGPAIGARTLATMTFVGWWSRFNSLHRRYCPYSISLCRTWYSMRELRPSDEAIARAALYKQNCEFNCEQKQAGLRWLAEVSLLG